MASTTLRIRELTFQKTIVDDVVDHFLPAVPTPRFAAIVLTRIGNVLHDALHSPCS